MLKVRAIKKYKDANKKLVGYLIRDIETGQEMAVTKEGLKEAVAQGKVVVTNLTVTKDGRLLGHAGEIPVPRKKKKAEKSGVRLVKVITSGKEMVCGIVNMMDKQGYNTHSLNGLEENCEIVYIDTIMEEAKAFGYDNVKLDSEFKIDLAQSEIDKEPFGKFKTKANKILKDNGFESKLSVKKASKDSFYLVVDGMQEEWPDTIVEIYKALCAQAVKASKLRVRSVERGSVEFVGPDNVTQAKKVLEQFK